MTQFAKPFSPLTPAEAIERYSHELTFADPSDGNRTVIRPALIGTLFFERGSQPDVRKGLLDCVDRFRAMFGARLEGGKNGETKYSRKTPKGIEAIRTAILQTGVNYQVHFALSDVTDIHTAPEYLMKAMTGQELLETRYGELSYLKFVLPWSMAKSQDGLAQYHDLMAYLCQALPVRGGYGGLSPVLPYDGDCYLPQEYQLAQRFAGLEADAWAFAESRQYERGFIKGVNWYTVLGDPLLAELGGESAVRTALARDDIEIERCRQCLLIRAGDSPLLGAPEEGRLEPYVSVNRVVRGLRNPHRKAMHTYMVGVERFGEEESRQWVARFDEPDEEMAPSLPPRQSGLSVLPFETCPRTGRWVANHLHNQIVHVNAGELMPGPQRSGAGNQVIWYLLEDREDSGSGVDLSLAAPIPATLTARSRAICPKSGRWQAQLPAGVPMDSVIWEMARPIQVSEGECMPVVGLVSPSQEATVVWVWIGE
ncbi:type VI immunity family protein [Cupriavidus basilensis]|uniref:type VI immunity family protein n=1 Tax=Cupriavidus basilensis TaxID=68895 RepID=UPI00157B5383|nr:type VI immunity family protein [Cupriavidus basilensis]NUA32011.1 DUF3396 domain-containing protein [Cupriavidus basilensis]